MKSKTTSELIQFTSRPWWYTIRGSAMLLIGGLIATLSIISPNVYMFGESSSWVPLISVIVLLVGIFRCIDALASVTAQGLLYNLQGGTLDVVVGFLVFFSTNDIPDSLNLLIVGYLITQGIYRNILLSVAKIRNPMANRITGLISIILGLLIWFDWPTSAAWFLAFSLSIDICFRGWALIVMASSQKMEPSNDI